MTVQLDVLLENLHSDDSRLHFLRNVYTPGNTEVADRILAMSGDSSVIEKEIAHARQAGDVGRFRQMAKRHIDYHVRHDFDILLRAIVIGWQDPELADYAIQKMTSKPEDNRKLEEPLEYAAEIAQAFGKEEVARQQLERLVALQDRDSKYRFPAAQTLVKLGRFDEAIDRYLEECDGLAWISDALKLAREHSPARVTEVAQRGFDQYKSGSGFEGLYVECARQVGQTRAAEKTLLRYAQTMKIDNPPSFYEKLVKALVQLNHVEEARQVVERVAQHEEQVKSSERRYEFDRPAELAILYHAIGQTDAVRNIYAERIDIRIREGYDHSNVINDINRAIELTGDRATFLEKRMLLHEKHGKYEQASKLAAELRKPKLAENYRQMHQMVISVKAQPK